MNLHLFQQAMFKASIWIFCVRNEIPRVAKSLTVKQGRPPKVEPCEDQASHLESTASFQLPRVLF